MRVMLTGEPNAVIPDGAELTNVSIPYVGRYVFTKFVVAWPWWRRWLSSIGLRSVAPRFDARGRQWVTARKVR